MSSSNTEARENKQLLYEKNKMLEQLRHAENKIKSQQSKIEKLEETEKHYQAS